MTSPAAAKPPFPIVKKADISAALHNRAHFLNPAANGERACISDMAGMGETLGVHIHSFPPGVETTEMHHHINDAEWLYILSGSATARLTQVQTLPGEDKAGVVPHVPHTLPIEEHTVSEGDFLGFPGGAGGAHFAHTMIAGPEGVKYLVGGTRSPLDVCTYPLKEKTLLHTRAGGRALADSGVLTNARPAGE